MKLQQLYSYTRQAIDDYHMIEAGDKIAVGISGGKDSLTLLYALSGLRRFYPKKFELIAISVDLGYDNFVKNLTFPTISFRPKYRKSYPKNVKNLRLVRFALS